MRTLTIVLLTLFASPVLAQGSFYVGLGLGAFDYEDDNFVRVISTNIPRFGGVSNTALSYKLYGGFELSDNFAVELSYGATDELEGEGFGFDPPPLPGDFSFSIRTEFTAIAAKAIGRLPLERSVLLGSLGYLEVDGNALFRTVSGSGPAGGSVSFDEDGLVYALGIEWPVARSDPGYRVRLEYESWDVDDADASTLGVGVSYRF